MNFKVAKIGDLKTHDRAIGLLERKSQGRV